MRRSRISQAKMVGFSRLYCSILETTVGVATLGFDPPMMPVGRIEPAEINRENSYSTQSLNTVLLSNEYHENNWYYPWINYE